MDTTTIINIERVFNLQLASKTRIGMSSYKERIKKLKALQVAVQEKYRSGLQEAIYADFKKPKLETDLTEIYNVVGEIKHAIKHLKKWMAAEQVATPLSLLGSSSWVKYDSKGICLLISPWNYPINLTLGPLVSAIAAGNTVIIKPSELTAHTSNVLKKLISDVFSEDEVVLFTGGVSIAQALLKLPFNHIFFTGAPSIGKIVMKAAAEHLTSVTLELGGKSPVIIDETANIKKAVKRIAWSKFLNAGQTCIAPDYVLIHHSKKEAFIEELKQVLNLFYTKDVSLSKSYCTIVNDKHYKRLLSYLDDAKAKKATVVIGGDTNDSTNYIAPTIVTNLSDDSLLMNEEIFGPILPIKTYNNLQETITYVNTKEQPLALYVFSKSKKNIDLVVSQTRAGGSCINNCVLHFSNYNLPFGGVNTSGIGRSHGFYGFKAFSNERAFYKQHLPSISELLFPPYTSFKEKLTRLTIKWF